MSLGHAWHSFWFAPGRAEDLALSRILFAGGLLVFSCTKSIHDWGDVPAGYLQPANFFRPLAIPIAPSGVLALLEHVWHLALFTLTIGLFTRSSAAVACALGLYLFGLDAPERLGRAYAPGVFVPLILAASCAGDALSVDAILLRRRGRPALPSPQEYGWPRKLVCVFLAYVFFASGVAKIRATGFPDWMLSDMTYRSLLVGNYWYVSDRLAALPLGPLMLRTNEHFAVVLGITIQLTELLYPLALFVRPARLVLVPLMLALLCGIALAMGPLFLVTMLAHVFWVPWSALLDRVRARGPAAAP